MPYSLHYNNGDHKDDNGGVTYNLEEVVEDKRGIKVFP